MRRTNANQDPSPGESRARRDGEHVRVFHRLQPWTINFPPPTAVSPKASCIIPFEPAMPLSMIPASSMVLLLCLVGLNLRPFAQYPWITGVYIYPGVTRPLDCRPQRTKHPKERLPNTLAHAFRVLPRLTNSRRPCWRVPSHSSPDKEDIVSHLERSARTHILPLRLFSSSWKIFPGAFFFL